jgi:uncharacterized membrane protein
MSIRYIKTIHTLGYVQNIIYFVRIEHGAQTPWCPGYFTYIYIGKLDGIPKSTYSTIEMLIRTFWWVATCMPVMHFLFKMNN